MYASAWTGETMTSTTTDQATRPLSNGEAAEWLGVAPETLATWRYLGKGPRYYRAGSRIKYFLADLRDFLARGDV